MNVDNLRKLAAKWEARASHAGVSQRHEIWLCAAELCAELDAEGADLSEAAMAEARLADMMRDPRYWRQRDPEFIARVTEGFKQLYAEPPR